MAINDNIGKVSRISNSFSTGNGGGNFEQQIQAMFLLSLLVDGFCPAMSERTKMICFQAKQLGYAVDDLVVITHRGESEGHFLCQIKHSITATANDKTFGEVIRAAWNDFNNDGFDKRNDKISLATAQIAIGSLKALRFLHSQANASIDHTHFFNRIQQQNSSNRDSQEMLQAIEHHISQYIGHKPEQDELWKFCKVFVLLLFDMDCLEI